LSGANAGHRRHIIALGLIALVRRLRIANWAVELSAISLPECSVLP